MSRATIALSLVLLLAVPLAVRAGEPQERLRLTVDTIMRGHGLFGYEPAGVRWSGDGQRVYFEWKQGPEPHEKEPDTYVVNRDGSGLRKLSEEEAREAPPAEGERSRDGSLVAYVDRGDVNVYDLKAGVRRRVTATAEAESDPHVTHDGRAIAFTRADNLFVVPLDSGAVAQMTNITADGPPDEKPGTESQEFLKKEERELLDAVRRRAAKREEEKARKQRDEPRAPFKLGPKQSVEQLRLTPDGRYVVASIEERDDGSKRSIVPNYVTESGYTEDIPARAKVGDAQPRGRLAILDVATGAATWVDHGQKTRGEKPENRLVGLRMPVWSKDGTKAVLLGRSADNKDRWIFALDAATGKTRVLAADHDDAWIGGPGAGTLGWLPDNETVYFQSERDGFSHLYTVRYDGGPARQLTSGRWEVWNTRLSDDGTRFYLTTNEAHPGERHLYAMAIAGGERALLTGMPGENDALPSPDGRALAIVRSFSNQPPELYVGEVGSSAAAVRVTTSPAPDFATYEWIEPPIVRFKARDGAMVPARVYKPKGFKRGGPAVVFSHGAGYLQNAHRGWSYYAREYMFHHLLMERGYMVVDVDYRGSAGYGRDWRTAIYNRMGGPDLDDHVDAARWLVAEHGVAPDRIGIYGGSYGGFIALMAMFTQPKVFAAGAALRPVTDWAHYNHPYTSNILELPQTNAEVYRKSSPIHHAAGLEGALLICHGMVDVNVHFQDTVRLVQRLIELRKENWELAVYPVEDHSFVEPTSWADEYKRILRLFETNLRHQSRSR